MSTTQYECLVCQLRHPCEELAELHAQTAHLFEDKHTPRTLKCKSHAHDTILNCLLSRSIPLKDYYAAIGYHFQGIKSRDGGGIY